MKNIKLFYLAFSLMVITALSYQGCSELDKTATVAPELGIHPTGWADTNNQSSDNFHGKYIYNNKQWLLTACRTCHGSDYTGGSTGVSCLTCHTRSNGPENCRTCHGGVSGHANPPRALNGDTLTTSLGVGMHMAHLYNTNWSAQVSCEECHTDFNGFEDPLHIGPNPDGIAEINFGPLAKDSTHGTHPNPFWDRGNRTCATPYCHGNFVGGNQTQSPVWTNEETVVCGSCHGDPGTGNPTPRINGVITPPHYSFMTINSCYVCHGSVINPAGQFVDKTLHVNGNIDFGLGK